MKKYFIFLSAFLLSSFFLHAQYPVTIGTGTSITNEPISGLYGKHRSVSIYTPADGLIPGTIQNLAWNKPSAVYSNIPIKIYLKEVSTGTLSATSSLIWNDLILGATLVYEGMPTWTSGATWVTIPLQTSFTYGTGNIMVLVASNKGGTGGSSVSWAYTAFGTNNNAYVRRDSSSTNTGMNDGISFSANSTTSALNNQRPNIRFSFIPTPGSCPPIYDIKASVVTDRGATINWTNAFNETQWVVSYKADTAGGRWTNDATVSAPTISLNNLASKTSYTIKVKSKCGTGDADTSKPTILSFTTACSQPEIPLTEGFETTATGLTSSPNTPSCWSYIRTYSSAYAYVAAIAGNAQSGSKYYHLYHPSSNATSNETMLVSPYFEHLDSLRVRFWAKYTSGTNSLQIGYMSNPADVGTFQEVSRIPLTNAWKEYKVNFNLVSQPAHYIAFSAKPLSNVANYIFLDSIIIERLPDCRDISNLKLTDLSPTSGAVSWHANPEAVSYEIQYKSEETPNWPSPTQVYANNYSLSNLLPQTTYLFTVRSVCASGYGAWSDDTLSFTTPCTASVLPISENFDFTPAGSSSSPNAPTCWSFVKDFSSAYAYVYTSSPNTYPNCYYLNNSTSTSIQKTALISPYFSENINRVRTRFMAKGNGYILNVGYLKVYGDISSFVQQKAIELTSSWTPYKVSFDTVTSTGHCIIFMHGQASTSQAIYLDDIIIEPTPPCNDVENISAARITKDSVYLVFDCEKETFNIEYREVGQTGWTNLNNIQGSNAISIGNLTTNTAYEVKIQSICSENTLGDWSSSFFFNTHPDIIPVPFTENFENSGDIRTKWNVINWDQTNKWHIGTAIYTGNGVNTAYISSDGGLNNIYSITAVSVSHLYADIEIPEGGQNQEITLSFDYKADGESATAATGVITIDDYLRVSLIDNKTFPVAGTEITEEANVLISKLSRTTEWTKAEVTIPDSLFGKTKRLVFSWKNDNSAGNQPPAAIDNIDIKIINCKTPGNLRIKNYGVDSLTLAWDSTGDSYRISYREAEGNDNWITETANDTNYTIGNQRALKPNTLYEIRVQNNCGSEQSPWNTIQARTNCSSVSFPIIEGFEMLGTGSSSNMNTPYCWSYNRSSTSAYGYVSSSYAHSGSRGYYLNSSSTSALGMLISPALTEDITTLRIKLWLHYNSTSSFYTVRVGYITNPDSVNTFCPVDTFLTTGAWEEYVLDFSSVTSVSPGTTYHIAIDGKPLSGSSNYVYLDDITIEKIPVCNDTVKNLKVSNITTTSAQINCTPVPGATGYDIYYRIKNGNKIWDTLTTTSLPVSITLKPNKNYEVMMRSHCETGKGNWSNISGFYSAFEVPYFQDFDLDPIGNVIQLGWWVWTTNGNACKFYVTTNPTEYYSPRGAIESFNGACQPSDVMYWISPQIDSSAHMNTLQVRFKARVNSGTANLAVGVMNLDSISSFELVESVPITTEWNTYTVYLNNYTGVNNRIGLGHNGNTPSTYIHMDDIEISPIPDCKKVSDLSVNNLLPYGFDLNWKSISDTTNYTLEYKIKTSTELQIQTVASNSFSFSGLDPLTTYQIRVKANCGSDVWSDVFMVTTPQEPAEITFYEDFENDPQWVFVNGTEVNKWIIDTVSDANNTPGGSHGLHIYSSYGPYRYAPNIASSTYAYRAIDFSSAPSTYQIKFNWKAKGGTSASGDNLRVMLVPSNVNISAGVILPTSVGINLGETDNLYGKDTWQHNEKVFRVNEPGIYNLVVCWNTTTTVGTQPPAAVDSIEITDLRCPFPLNFIVDTTLSASNSLTVNWVSEGDTFGLQYRKVTETGSEWISINCDTTTYHLTGLDPDTQYEFRLRRFCSSEDTSRFTRSIFGTTLCTSIPQASLPWFESFENITTANTLPDCMKATRLGSKVLSRLSAQSSNNQQPNTGSKFVSFVWGCDDYLYTPMFNLQAGTSYRFSFWYITDGLSGWQNLEARLCKGFTNANSMRIGTSLTNLTNTNYNSFVVDFTPTETGDYCISLYCKAGTPPYYLSIDDLGLRVTPVCRDIISDLQGAPTSSSVKLSWATNGSATNFNIVYRIKDTIIHPWTRISNVSGNTHTVSGLTAGLTYEFRVQANCGNGNLGDTSNIFSVKIPCLGVLPLAEGFENTGGSSSVSEAPACWSYIKTYSTSYSYGSTASPRSGNKCYYIYQAMGGIHDLLLISPYLQEPLNTLRTSFWVKYSSELTLSVGYMDNPEDLNTFNLVRTISGTYPSWTKFRVSFEGLPSDAGHFVAFSAKKTSGSQYLYLDDILIEPIPPCKDVTGIKFINLAQTSTTVKWDTISGASAYDLQYKRTADTAWSSIITVATNSYNLSGLQANTGYEVRLRSKCNASDSGAWGDPSSFVTPCVSSTLPIVEGFEITATTNPSAPGCWSYIKTHSSGTMNASTTSPHSGVRSYYLYHSSSQAATNGTMLVSPYFSEDISTVRTRFWARYSSSAYNRVIVGYMMNNPLDTSNFHAVDTVSLTSAWTPYKVSFSNIAPGSGAHHIAFNAKSPEGTNYVYLDDITIERIPICRDIEEIRIVNIDRTSATVKWDSVSGANGFDVQYRREGTTVWSTSLLVTVDSCNITGLLPSIYYEVRVRSKCNAADTGSWSYPSLFSTSCEATPLPYTENFAGTFLPACWEKGSDLLPKDSTAIQPSSTTSGWLQIGFTHVAGNPLAAKLNIFGTGAKYWLISPIIDLGNSGLTVLDFDLALTDYNNSNPAEGACTDDRFIVMVSSDTNWSESKAVALWNNQGSPRVYNDIATAGQRIRIPLNNHSGPVRIAFYGESTESGGDNDLFVGNISVMRYCDTIQSVTVEHTGTQATATWIPKTGQNQWEVSCLKTGTSEIISDIVNIDTTYTFQNLERGNSYTISVRNICNEGDTSALVVSAPFTINRCDTVSNINIEVCATTAFATWTAPAGQNRWEWVCTPQSGGTAISNIVTQARDSIKGLLPETSYSIKIRSICNPGDTGEFSSEKLFQTIDCQRVENITVPRNNKKDSIFVSWNDNPCQQKWEVRIVLKDEDVNSVASTVVYTYQGVWMAADPNRDCDVYVRADCGDTSRSAWQMAQSIIESIDGTVSSLVKVILAPNPAKDYTKLSIEGVSGEVEMILATPEGRVLRKEKLHCQPKISKDITLQGLAKGTYLIHLTHKNWTKVEKLIVQ